MTDRQYRIACPRLSNLGTSPSPLHRCSNCTRRRSRSRGSCRSHAELLKRIESRYHDFSGLDIRFHRLINEASPNRFIDDFYDIISFIFHYHYQWKKHGELQRNQAAIIEHLVYIDALESRDPERIERACRAHLASARATLMRSLIGFDE